MGRAGGSLWVALTEADDRPKRHAHCLKGLARIALGGSANEQAVPARLDDEPLELVEVALEALPFDAPAAGLKLLVEALEEQP